MSEFNEEDTMRQQMFWLMAVLFLSALLAFTTDVQYAYAANAVVGDGTPASCSETAFNSALTTANAGGGVITFNCGSATTTIAFTLAKIVNLSNVTVDGGGRIVLKAGNNERHFFAGGGVTFRLQDITLREGNSLVSGGAVEASMANVILSNVQLLDNASTVVGGAIYCFDGALTIINSLFQNNTAKESGGAIYNDGCALTVTGSTFRGNRALDTLGRGGAIDNRPTARLTMNNTVLQGNRATDGGALYVNDGATAVLDAVSFLANSGGYGGGVENSGALTITNSLFDGNTVTGSGGGLWNLAGKAVIRQTTVRNNRANEGGGVNSYGSLLEMKDINLVNNVAAGTHGGGLYHSGGVVFITNATISGNRASNAAGNGGGVYQNSDDNLVMTNVTLAENQAGALGGGIYHYGRYAILTNVTIADNKAGTAGDAIYEDSPLTPANPGIVQLVNSVILGSANNCDGSLFQSLGRNISNGTCASLNNATDRANYAGDLLLGALAFNGGAFPMQTRLPQAGSPLIDAADVGYCSAFDQRSGSRVGVCDIGAVEYGASVAVLYLPLVLQ
jgi:predicted outer membrane repeat protein